MTIWEGEPASLIQPGQLQVCSITNFGKAERICYPNGSSTVYEYEKGWQIKSVRYPDGAGEHYGYDAKGNLTERTTTAGESYRYNYDSLDRMISVQNPAGGISYFTYDALGRVIKGRKMKVEIRPAMNIPQTVILQKLRMPWEMRLSTSMMQWDI